VGNRSPHGPRLAGTPNFIGEGAYMHKTKENADDGGILHNKKEKEKGRGGWATKNDSRGWTNQCEARFQICGTTHC
jgi:hypothetical protein